MRRKGIAVLAAGAMALAAPTAFANHGAPHSTKPCPGKAAAHAQGPKISAPNTNGKKCGFNRTTNNTTTTTTS